MPLTKIYVQKKHIIYIYIYDVYKYILAYQNIDK